jgi:hydroxybutyrate-dimer hydrolase
VDAVVAVSPNVLPHTGGRPLYDYATEAALWMPCAAGVGELATAILPVDPSASAARCRSLQRSGLLSAQASDDLPRAAYDHLRSAGWTAGALESAVASTRLDLWRAVGAAYASAYLRRGPDDMPCGFGYVMSEGADPGLWWSDSSGIPPGAGVSLQGRAADGEDPSFSGMLCLRQLWTDDNEDARVLRAAIEATRAGALPTDRPVWLLHGEDDGLVPMAFSSAAYREANAQRSGLHFQPLPRAQHFDSLLALPAAATRYEPLMPSAYAALDAAWTALEAAE